MGSFCIVRSYIGELRERVIGPPLRWVGPVDVETCFSTSPSTLVQFSLCVTRQRSMQAVKETKERTFSRWLSTILGQGWMMPDFGKRLSFFLVTCRGSDMDGSSVI